MKKRKKEPLVVSVCTQRYNSASARLKNGLKMTANHTIVWLRTTRHIHVHELCISRRDMSKIIDRIEHENRTRNSQSMRQHDYVVRRTVDEAANESACLALGRISTYR